MQEASSKGKKVDTVELPPRMKSESKADIKVVAASNGTSSKVVFYTYYVLTLCISIVCYVLTL